MNNANVPPTINEANDRNVRLMFDPNWNTTGDVAFADMPASHQQQYKLYFNFWYFLTMYGTLFESMKTWIFNLRTFPLAGERGGEGSFVKLDDVYAQVSTFRQSVGFQKEDMMLRLTLALEATMNGRNIQVLTGLPDRHGNVNQDIGVPERLLAPYEKTTLAVIKEYIDNLYESFLDTVQSSLDDVPVQRRKAISYVGLEELFDIFEDLSFPLEDIKEQFMNDTSGY